MILCCHAVVTIPRYQFRGSIYRTCQTITAIYSDKEDGVNRRSEMCAGSSRLRG